MRRDEAMKPCPLCESHGEVTLTCPVCKGSGLIRDIPPSERKKIRNNISRKGATRTGKRLSKKDWRVIEDSSLSAQQAACRLCRSIKSIESARSRLRKERYGTKETNESDAD